MSFLYDSAPEDGFQLSYISIVSSKNEVFSEFWEETVVPHVESCGYNIETSTTIFAAISVNDGRFSQEILEETLAVLQSGFSSKQALELLVSAINESGSNMEKAVYSGFCLDAGLQQRIRESLWIFTEAEYL